MNLFEFLAPFKKTGFKNKAFSLKLWRHFLRFKKTGFKPVLKIMAPCPADKQVLV